MSISGLWAHMCILTHTHHTKQTNPGHILGIDVRRKTPSNYYFHETPKMLPFKSISFHFIDLFLRMNVEINPVDVNPRRSVLVAGDFIC